MARFAIPASILLFASCGGGDGGGGPGERVPTTLTLSQTQVTLDAINATVQLTATVRDQNGQPMSATITWVSNAPAIVSVQQNGTLTALANGPATVTASSGSLSANANVLVEQRAAVIVRVSGNEQTAPVTQPLPDPIVVRIEDRLGTVIQNVQVQFETQNGQVNPVQALTGAGGQAQTLWTLGTVANSTGVTPTLFARVIATGIENTFTATALPAAPMTITAALGDGQRQVIGRELPDSIITLVADVFGNGVPGVQVQFAALAGNGAVADAALMTNASGQAGTTWTLGNTTGQQTARSTTAVLPGQNADFTADAIDPAVGIGPGAGMVEGELGTLTGEGYHPDADSNRVTVDGLPAPVESVQIDPNGDDGITFRVPVFDCMPARDVDVVIAIGEAFDTINHRLNPANAIDDDNDFAVGDRRLIVGNGTACLQFLPSEFDNERYIIGFGASNQVLVATAFSLVASQGAAQPPQAPPLSAQSLPAAPVAPPSRGQIRLSATPAEERAAARAASMNPGPIQAAAASRSVPIAGEQLSVRILQPNAQTCADYVQIQTTVRVVGQHVAIATDDAIASADPLTLADFQALSDQIDAVIGPTVVNYFGPAQDTDANQRIVLVFSPRVNARGGSYVSVDDLVPRSVCALSNEGEFAYVIVPNGVTRAELVAALPGLTTQLLSLIRLQGRVLAPGGTLLEFWEEDGLVQLALEAVAHATAANVPYQNYGAAVVASSTTYQDLFNQLSAYFGWDGGAGHVQLAPVNCSLFFFTSFCNPDSRPGAAWSFARYLADRLGPTYPGGETQLIRDWVNAHPTLSAATNIEAVTGELFEQLFADWGAALFTDEANGLDQAVLGFRSWNLQDIFGARPVEQQLQRGFTVFQNFAVNGTLASGGTGYIELVGDGGTHPALAIRFESASELGLVLWVVRIE